MSIVTLHRKTMNRYHPKTKKNANRKIVYAGPYGDPGSVASVIFREPFDSDSPYLSTFSSTGGHRSISVGKDMKMSKSRTPYRGVHAVGWGGTCGKYPDRSTTYTVNSLDVSSIVKPPVLSNWGMLKRRYRWINSGKYPTYWVQPVDTGNMVDNTSQGTYIHNKSSANDCVTDVNNTAKYIGNTDKGCIGYTKTINQATTSSEHVHRLQIRCQNQSCIQKPFPPRVQTGIGIIRGGMSIVGNCINSNTLSQVRVEPNCSTGK